MTRVTIHEAQARLPELIEKLISGGEVQITHGDRPVARLVGESRRPWQPRPHIHLEPKDEGIPENEEVLEDFEYYMP